MSQPILCTNDKCHMKDICLLWTTKQVPFQVFRYYRPIDNDCHGFALDEHTGLTTAELDSIRSQSADTHLKTPSLF